MIPPLTAIGRIAGKHGFRGEMNLIFEHQDYRKLIKKGNFLFIEIDKKGVPFFIESIAAGGQTVKLKDINSDKDALQYSGLNVLLESAAVKIPKSANFNGLIGFRISDIRTGFTGNITQVQEFPQGLMFTVNTIEKEYLIPAVEEWIEEIDENQLLIYMNLPEGLTDL